MCKCESVENSVQCQDLQYVNPKSPKVSKTPPKPFLKSCVMISRGWHKYYEKDKRDTLDLPLYSFGPMLYFYIVCACHAEARPICPPHHYKTRDCKQCLGPSGSITDYKLDTVTGSTLYNNTYADTRTRVFLIIIGCKACKATACTVHAKFRHYTYISQLVKLC